MSLWTQLKESLGERRLKMRKDPRSKPAMANFATARSVALLYREKGEGFYILVKQYVKFLKAELGIREVLALSYIEDHKDIPHYHLHRLRYDYFTSKNLDFFMEPTGEEVERFVEKDYDILIDLEKDPSLPLRYVLRMSKARLKVGHYSEAYEHLYDLMIRCDERATFDEYIKQVNHYLRKINSHEERA